LLVLICLAAYAVMSFRRAIAVHDTPSTRVLAEARRIANSGSPRRRWLRPTVATVLGWSGIMVTLTPVNPTMAVWIGGGVVMLGTAAIVASVPNPMKIDDAEFERELRDLLDQYSS
jgi:hypothetical protein